MFCLLSQSASLKLHCKSTVYFRNMQYICRKILRKMKILGIGNALVDVLSKLDSDETLVK